MALTPEQIAGFQAAAEEIAAPVVEWLLRDITERVKLAGEMTSTAAYEAYRAQALGESKKALKAYLKKQLQVSEKEAQALLEAAASFAQEDDYARVGVWATEADGTSLARLTAAAVKQAGEQLENLTGTLGMTSPHTGQPLPLQKVYRECMDDALKLVSTGAATASEAARQATRQLAGRGVVSIDYASGVSTELGAAVRRNLMGGMGQLVEQVTQMDHDDLGCNGWEISAHANSAPDHEPFQGRQYSDAEFKRLNESLARRIGTLNCGHVAMPIIMGVDSPQYTQSELDAFREENAQGVTWEGRHMTGYEATQYQNRIERGIRRQKHRVLMSEAAGDEEQLLHDRVKLTRLNQEYARFNKAMGFKSRAERLEVLGKKQKLISAEKLHKLNFSEDVPVEQRVSIEKELSVLPRAHREAAEQQISRIRVEDNPKGSYYDPASKELIMSSTRKPGDVIHEYGHALDRALKLERDATFIEIRKKGIDVAAIDKIVYDEDTFTEPIWRMTNDKFVSEYQGRMYESYGIYDGTEINLSSMKDYFPEGYREFFMDPDNLKAHDPDLYDYIRGLLDDQR